MPHFKCVGCKLRVHADSPPVNDVGDDCPVCGVPLEPVADLGELVGFQSVSRPNHEIATRGHHLLVAQIAEFQVRRDAAELARAEGERWTEDGGAPLPGVQTMALPLPGTEL
jgi:hypothetical protein